MLRVRHEESVDVIVGRPERQQASLLPLREDHACDDAKRRHRRRNGAVVFQPKRHVEAERGVEGLAIPTGGFRESWASGSPSRAGGIELSRT